MPRNQFQRMVFAFLTVLVTVHVYVFYSLYVVNGSTLMQFTGADSVLQAINLQGGVYMLGRMMPIWAVVIIEFVFAYILQMVQIKKSDDEVSQTGYEIHSNIYCTSLLFCLC